MIALVALVCDAQADDGSVRHHVAQARQFVKNKWYEDAAVEIEAALAAPNGLDSFDAHWLGAQIYYELVDVDRAAALAERAAALAPNADAREQAANYSQFLRENFGVIEVTGPEAGMRSRLQLERSSVVFDADLKRLIAKVSARVHEPTPLPTRIGVPAGDYLLNGVAVTVPAGGTAPVALQMRQLGAQGMAALQRVRLEVGGGVSVLFGERVSNLRPGGAFDLSLTIPVGPLLIGAVGAFDLRSYHAAGAATTLDPRTFAGGVRVGRELALSGPLTLRPSLGVRYGLVPGIGFGCDETDDVLACTPAVDGAEVEIYALGTAVTPFLELAAEYREAGRTTAVGVGVKIIVEEHVGAVASPGEAALYDNPDATLPYTATPATWTATGVRLLADLSIAF